MEDRYAAEDLSLERFDIEPFARAIERARQSLRVAHSSLAADPELAVEFRQSSIRTFALGYELAIKTLIRFLSLIPAASDPTRASFPQLIRLGHEQGVLSASLEAWGRFRSMRNRTSYTYDDEIAAEVFAEIPRFVEEAAFLYAAIERRMTFAT